MLRIGTIVAILVVAVNIVYVAIAGGQGASDQPLRVPFVAGYLVTLAVCAAIAAGTPSNRWRAGLLGASAAGLVLLGLFAIFSIGLPLLVAGLLAVAGLVRLIGLTSQPRSLLARSLAGGVIAVVLLFGGFAITERIIACPPGAVSGEGGGLFTSYSYTCQNGHATVTYR